MDRFCCVLLFFRPIMSFQIAPTIECLHWRSCLSLAFDVLLSQGVLNTRPFMEYASGVCACGPSKYGFMVICPATCIGLCSSHKPRHYCLARKLSDRLMLISPSNTLPAAFTA
ncbi:unnamed protein product [Durusdinium trenchii]|uniref:Secreted protein n=1 Tax=Durusdinium trenchii TaxID=1381693 RepID=A0ABP0PWT0_9DINO